MKNLFLILLSCLFVSSLQAQESTDSLNYYIQNFQFTKALQWIDDQEDTVNNKFQKAMCYKALGENKTAIEILQEMAEDFPEDIKIKTELANCYERVSRWKDTSNTYASLMTIDPTNLYFSIKKAEAEINRKNYKQAIRDLELVLEKDTLLSAVKLLGKTYEMSNKLDSAIYYYNVAWSADSLDSFSASNLVNVLLKNRKYDQALDYSMKSLALVPEDKSLNMLNGYSYYALEDYDNAATVLEGCFMMGDSSLVVNRSLGISFYFKKDSECAYEYLSKAYLQDTTNAVVIYNLAVSAREIGKYKESINLHETLLERMIPSNMQLYLNYKNLAMAYEKNENYSDAIGNYLKTLEYANTDQRMEILYPLAFIYEYKLEDHSSNKYKALNYYEQYKSALFGYITYLKQEEENTSPEIIVEYESQLESLDKHIGELKKYISENIPAPITEKDFLYVLDDKVVPSCPTGNVISKLFILNLSKADVKFHPLVEVAKKQNKRAIAIFTTKEEDEKKGEITN